MELRLRYDHLLDCVNIFQKFVCRVSSPFLSVSAEDTNHKVVSTLLVK